jgi:hypothetical protein
VSETIEEWAARRAHQLDAEGWRRLNLAASGVLWSDDERLVLADGTEVDHQQARALRAVRDRVVSKIGPHTGKWLTEHAELLSDFGRECARVLREGK